MPSPAKRSNTSGNTFSVIGSDVTITGNIVAEVDLHVDGRIEGDIKCASLVQGESSEVHGAVVADSARLSGLVNGSIEARDLVVEHSARITGDVTYETISIEQGGHIDGQFKHKNSAATPAKPRVVPSEDEKPTLDLDSEQAA